MNHIHQRNAMLKRIASMCLIATMLLSMGATALAADEKISYSSMEGILDSYHTQMQRVQATPPTRSSDIEKMEIQEATVKALNDAGYEAYNVNSDTFEEVEKALETDLEQIGLDPNSSYSYIIALSAENPENANEKVSTYGTGAQFNYTYKGKVYKLRQLTITAADDPIYGKASYVDLLKTTSQKVFENCLNTAITAYIGAYSGVLGTVASLCGFDVADFSPAGTTTLVLHGGSNWTRMYTQVLRDTGWVSGSAVETAKANSFFSGQTYSKSGNRYVQVPQKERSVKMKSTHYLDATWRNEQAIIGSGAAWISYDSVGDVKYYYGDVVKITHRRNF